jgi:DNA-binding PadR family transcriptional regulator
VLKFALLGLLSKESRHGYDLKRAFERLLGGTWPINIGQIYTTLTRLERDGLVTAETVAQSNVPDRKMYSLTAAGHEALAEWLGQPVGDEVVLKDEMFLKVLVHGIVENGDASDLVWRQRQHQLQLLAELEDLRADPDLDRATRLVLEGAMLHVEADLQWLDLAERELDL